MKKVLLWILLLLLIILPPLILLGLFMSVLFSGLISLDYRIGSMNPKSFFYFLFSSRTARAIATVASARGASPLKVLLISTA